MSEQADCYSAVFSFHGTASSRNGVECSECNFSNLKHTFSLLCGEISREHLLTRYLYPQALVALYEEPERPQDAAGYLKINFAGHGALVSELDTAKSENGALKQRMVTLEKELGDVKTENRQLKPKMENQVQIHYLFFALSFFFLSISFIKLFHMRFICHFRIFPDHGSC